MSIPCVPWLWRPSMCWTERARSRLSAHSAEPKARLRGAYKIATIWLGYRLGRIQPWIVVCSYGSGDWLA